ncbi:MAG: RNase J family beta-CASP ribonuclease [Candidatus Woesearchaeota archaeon]
MPIEIRSIGGYDEVGKNCTAIKIDDEVVICDMGLHLENYIRFTEDEDIINISPSELIKEKAVPDITQIKEWHKRVIAIIPTHAHLDHIGAVPFLGNYFKAPIICTPFSAAVLQAILTDEKIHLNNKIKVLNAGSTIKISKNIKIEFINMTHSTPQTVMVAIHTKYGIVLYANDFKFDIYPTLGQKTDFAKLRELGNRNIFALIVESTYAPEAIKMPSEAVAKEMLRDVMIGTESKGKTIIVTTFSSHIARLKSIIEFGKKLGRKIVFLGRSLSKYTNAAESIKLVNFSKEVDIVRFSSKIKRELKKIEKDGKEKYLLVVTGHQGEPKATLSKIARGEFGFRLDPGDHVIFSCKTIPTPTNIKNREDLENDLKKYGVRIFKDIHISGHAGREDLRDLISLVKPKHLIPAHGDQRMTKALYDLAIEMGYDKDNVHIMRDLNHLKLE